LALTAIFITGLITSLHCIAMCGNFVLTFSVTGQGKNASKLASILPQIYYNGAKLISYGTVGAMAGLLGAVLNLGKFRGWVSIIAGVFMILLALNMLDVHPWLRVFSVRMPKFITRRIFKSAQREDQFAPVFFGLINGFMPCGPLQAMVLYAASTGSALSGSATMLAFGLGTVPLMLFYGTFASYLAKRFQKPMMVFAAIVVIVLGLVVLNRGLVLNGFKYNFKYAQDNIASLFVESEQKPVETVETGTSKVQERRIDIQGRYVPDTLDVKVGSKVRITFYRPDNDACSEYIVFPAFGIDKRLKPFGETVIEFTPKEAGTFTFTCGMGMYQGTLNVTGSGGTVKISTADIWRNRLIAFIIVLGMTLTVGLKVFEKPVEQKSNNKKRPKKKRR
jgi:sulfite exporter TauE/SafE